MQSRRSDIRFRKNGFSSLLDFHFVRSAGQSDIYVYTILSSCMYGDRMTTTVKPTSDEERVPREERERQGRGEGGSGRRRGARTRQMEKEKKVRPREKVRGTRRAEGSSG